MKEEGRTGGREATGAVIPGRFALSVGKPQVAPRGFTWTALSDVARLESGHTPSRSMQEYWNGTIPWLGIRDATANHGQTIFDTQQHVSQSGLDNSSARLLPAGTVCLSRTASVGFVVTMGVPMATSQDFVNWVCGPGLSHHYLHYILVAEQESVRRFAHGTTHQTMYYPEAKALHVLLPARPTQDAIAEVLGSLDEKISSNRNLARTSDALSARFYQSLVKDQSEWLPLSSLAHFVNGKAFTKDASGDGRLVIRIAELNSGIGNSTVYNDIQVAERHLARPGDLLFAWSGSLTVHRWYRSEGIVNQHIFKVVPINHPMWVVNCALRGKLAEFKAIAADKATTMGHIQRRHLDEVVAVPSAERIASIDALMSGLWKRALAAERENLQLAELRDSLLPALLSGAIRVKDAERIVEEVS